jgi:NADH-quinone oxidoreductase subunit M
MKKLVAYSSVSHLRFIVLGIFSFTELGMQGRSTRCSTTEYRPDTLPCVGIIYERRHPRLIAEYGGLATVMPRYSTLFIIVALSKSGLPLLNGFVGEFLILIGTFSSERPTQKCLQSLLQLALFSAVYLLWMLQRVLFGEVTKSENSTLEEMNWREENSPCSTGNYGYCDGCGANDLSPRNI